ncbi:unnamed protein product [Didymodactylos carnosus]|uniref:Uncharacterized protein n=1 Tax=Didymodactylos carnosus TaxID=1234261 RepID=A0A814RPE4_9BILA|nr:unnamed protein product [Didymodactylos carnosus]CAF3899318.1 unnamed protein product [Didymodactylos carnosus]
MSDKISVYGVENPQLNTGQKVIIRTLYDYVSNYKRLIPFGCELSKQDPELWIEYICELCPIRFYVIGDGIAYQNNWDKQMITYDLEKNKKNDLESPNIWKCLLKGEIKLESIQAIEGLEFYLKTVPPLLLDEIKSLASELSGAIHCADSKLNERSNSVTSKLYQWFKTAVQSQRIKLNIVTIPANFKLPIQALDRPNINDYNYSVLCTQMDIEPYQRHYSQPFVYLNYSDCNEQEKNDALQLIEKDLGKEKFKIIDYSHYSDWRTNQNILTLINEDVLYVITIFGTDSAKTDENELAKRVYDFIPKNRMSEINSQGHLCLRVPETHDYRYLVSYVYIAYVHCTPDEIEKFNELLEKLQNQLGPNYRFATYRNYEFIRNFGLIIDTIKRNSVYYIVVRGSKYESTEVPMNHEDIVAQYLENYIQASAECKGFVFRYSYEDKTLLKHPTVLIYQKLAIKNLFDSIQHTLIMRQINLAFNQMAFVYNLHCQPLQSGNLCLNELEFYFF